MPPGGSGKRNAAVDNPSRPIPLTEKELRILRAIARGETNSEIAEEIGRSQETVKTHVRHLLEKLGAKSRTHAVNLAWEAGWWGEGLHITGLSIAREDESESGQPRRQRAQTISDQI